MRLVTVATHSDGYFEQLCATCARHGAVLDVLGWGEPWQGFCWRLALMKTYVADLPSDEIVCFIDAYDVLLLRPLQELERDFIAFAKQHDVKLLTGCDRIANPFVSWMASRFIFGMESNERPNMGTYIGSASAVHCMTSALLQMSSRPSDDDQVLMSQYIQKHPEGVLVDTDGYFFATECVLARSILEDPCFHIVKAQPSLDIEMHCINESPSPTELPGQNVLLYKENRPFILHGNGNTILDDVYEALGYPLHEKQKARLRTYRFRFLWWKFWHYSWTFFPRTLFLLLLSPILLALLVIVWFGASAGEVSLLPASF